MFYPLHMERDTALDRCPDAWCRRAGHCRAAGGPTPCLRTHESLDDVRYRIADTIDAFVRECGYAKPAGPIDENSYEFQLKLADLKRCFEERLKAEDRKPRRP